MTWRLSDLQLARSVLPGTLGVAKKPEGEMARYSFARPTTHPRARYSTNMQDSTGRTKPGLYGQQKIREDYAEESAYTLPHCMFREAQNEPKNEK